MADMAEGRLVELTSVGSTPTQRNCKAAMYANFPQIFADGDRGGCPFHVVIRWYNIHDIQCLQLQAINPNLCIKNDASYHDMYYMNPPTKDSVK